MSIKVNCTVHSAGIGLVPVVAKVDGRDTRVLVDGVSVDLLTEDNHNLQLSLYGDQLSEALRLFHNDAKITMTLDTAEGTK